MVIASSSRTWHTLLLCLSLLQSISSAPTPKTALSIPKKKQSHTVKFSQRATSSRHGDGFKARHKRREYDLHRRSIEKRQASDDDSPLYNLEDARYIVHITIGGQDLQVIIDSGSTDTFVYSVQPYNQNNGSPPPLFNNRTASPLYDLGLTYNASYGSGNGLSNTIGSSLLSNVAIDGSDLAVTNLTFADLYQTTNGVGASGLMGLGFPLNGNIWSDAVLAIYGQTKQKVSQAVSSSYFPIVPLLYYQNQIASSMYSLVVTRMGPNDANNPKSSGGTLPTSPQATLLSEGTMVFGDYPESMNEDQFTWCDVPVVTVSDQYREYGFPDSTGNRWTTKTDAIFFNGVKLIDSRIQPEAEANYALLDTGNPILAMASDVLAQITNAWAANPDNFVLPCDSAFDLVFQFGGQNFTIAKEDVLVPSTAAIDSYNYGGYARTDCQAQIQPFTPTGNEVGPETSQTHHLGDVFFRNVISVFDYGDLYNAASNPPRIGLYSTTAPGSNT
ncbi:acid protease [Cystobasidium minutum MCA 4210]|uniref:acid protease n=1 Tax=Cystobasidium minutum MCA 4210 TaxID=1397322 RepID=UPI0034CD38F1|eukprot:jgi/Rhomi1/173006/fgenesh1_kg.5_\